MLDDLPDPFDWEFQEESVLAGKLKVDDGTLVVAGEEGLVEHAGDGSCGIEDAEVLVDEAMRRVPGCDVPIEQRPMDVSEDQAVEMFLRRGCGCMKWNGSHCSDRFSPDYVKEIRLNFKALAGENKHLLDAFVKGEMMACCNFLPETTSTMRNTPHPRKKAYTSFQFQGQPICQDMFRLLHGVGRKYLKNLSRSLKVDGALPRVHGNTRRLPAHTLTLKSVEYVVRFLLNYCEQNGLLLPGRVPGYSKSDIKLLPSSVSKRGIWKVYFEAATETPDVHAVAYSTFCQLWRCQLPYLILMKPMTDLCATCQHNSTAVLRAANQPTSAKSDTLRQAQEHLRIVQVERSFYKTTCDECKRLVRDCFASPEGDFEPPPPDSQLPANSKDIEVHYSFDYAQQVHFPSDPMQPGPIYFLTPRKCGVFGVCCEAIPRQVTFLCDEAGDCGKGANTVVSQLHYFFEHHGLGEKKVFLHADNCTGQNKNNIMLHYLAWRVMAGLHTQITLSFLVVGHTKFSPDWCFGLFKRLYRRTKVGSLQAIAQVVDSSATCNVSQLVVESDGTVVVPTLNWTDLFAPYFRKFEGIKKYHHFRFDSSKPGVVVARIHSDMPEEEVNLLKDETWLPDPTELPDQVFPKGLSPERQWYLFDKIRQFCPEEDQDVSCPKPTVAKPRSRAGTPNMDDNVGDNATQPVPPSMEVLSEDDDDASLPVLKKKKRVSTCRTCRREGHNSRTCPDKKH